MSFIHPFNLQAGYFNRKQYSYTMSVFLGLVILYTLVPTRKKVIGIKIAKNKTEAIMSKLYID